MRRMLFLTLFSAVAPPTRLLAPEIPPPSEFCATPPALPLLRSQWTSLPAAPTGYSLEFFRTAEREPVLPTGAIESKP